MHRQIKHCNRIIEGLSAKEEQVECLCEKRKEKKRKENQT